MDEKSALAAPKFGRRRHSLQSPVQDRCSACWIWDDLCKIKLRLEMNKSDDYMAEETTCILLNISGA